MYVVTFAGVVSCSWGCTPIKSCAVIYSDLVTAKIAKEKHQDRKVDKSISIIRGYTCHDKAEQVCCPEYMGQFNNTITNTVNIVYAIKRDTIVIRSSMEESRWINTEAFFWREKSCFPRIGRLLFASVRIHASLDLRLPSRS